MPHGVVMWMECHTCDAGCLADSMALLLLWLLLSVLGDSGISHTEHSVFSLLAAVLHLGLLYQGIPMGLS